MNVLDLFSGIGGFSLGLERAGMRTVAFCEIDPFCRAVLRKHWPDVPIYTDIRCVTADGLYAEGIKPINLICGGFPCQDISTGNAVWGQQLGLDGERSGLYFEARRLICELRPDLALLENVTALVNGGLERILGSLAEIGYDAEWDCIGGEDIGAPQPRDRIWIVAYPHGSRRPGLVEGLNLGSIGQGWPGSASAVFASDPLMPGDSWPQPIVRRVDGRLPNRLDRIKCCGNSVFPQIPEIIGRAIMQAERLTR